MWNNLHFHFLYLMPLMEEVLIADSCCSLPGNVKYSKATIVYAFSTCSNFDLVLVLVHDPL